MSLTLFLLLIEQAHNPSNMALLNDRLKEFGNDKVEFLEWKGLFHVFQSFCMGFLAIPEAKKSLKEIAKFSEKYIN